MEKSYSKNWKKKKKSTLGRRNPYKLWNSIYKLDNFALSQRSPTGKEMI